MPVNVNPLQEGKAESAQDTVHDEHEGVPLPCQDANLGEREGERTIAGDAVVCEHGEDEQSGARGDDLGEQEDD